MHRLAHSTNGRSLAITGKGKEKLALDSAEAIQLLTDCKVAPGQVQRMMDGTPLINAWLIVAEGKEIVYCHSVKTNDDRTHILDFKGNVTTLSYGRDVFIGDLLQHSWLKVGVKVRYRRKHHLLGRLPAYLRASR